MALEFTFGTCLDLPKEQVEKAIIKLAKESATGVEARIVQSSVLCICCDYYTLYSTNDKETLDICAQISRMPVKFILDFELFADEWERGREAMMRLIGGLMRLSSDDCYLIANGDYPFVMRRGGKTVVDDSRWVDREHFPYEALGIDFEWGVIPYD